MRSITNIYSLSMSIAMPAELFYQGCGLGAHMSVVSSMSIVMPANYFARGVDLAHMSNVSSMSIAMPGSYFTRGVELARICLW